MAEKRATEAAGRSDTIWLDPMELVIANSFKDFHARGLDYLCLSRSPKFTRKIYLFQGDASRAPEVVNPHDHRYPFVTRCLSGGVTNFEYARCLRGAPDAMTYQRFDYRTPLNVGNGFTWAEEAHLCMMRAMHYPAGPGAYYFSRVGDIHTIKVTGNETVLELEQFDDELPIGQPTSTYCRDREPPSLSGLYSRFAPDEIISRMKRLEALTGQPVRMREWA